MSSKQKLCDAAEIGDIEVVKVQDLFSLTYLKKLVQVKKVDVNCRSAYLDRTPLHLAASQNKTEVCQFLLENKADPTLR
jgi:ankyrin repeat protein